MGFVNFLAYVKHLGEKALVFFPSKTDLISITENGNVTEELLSERLDTLLTKEGDASNVTVTFQEATEKANIKSGDSLATAFGKLAKFCSDLETNKDKIVNGDFSFEVSNGVLQGYRTVSGQKIEGGYSSIGTSSHPIYSIYANNICEGEKAISSKYAPINNPIFKGALSVPRVIANEGFSLKDSLQTRLCIIPIEGANNSGLGVQIGGGGLVVVGAGESPGNYYNTTDYPEKGAEEKLLLTSDQNILFVSNCQTIANRKEMELATSGRLINTNGFEGSLFGNADTATKAAQDAEGNTIVDTYALKSKYNTYYINLGKNNNPPIYSFAMGQEATAGGSYSFVMGQKATAGGNAFAMGQEATAGGSYSFAAGYKTTASGWYSFAMGQEATASGSRSHAVGYKTTASGDYSFAAGSNTTADTIYSCVFGKFNKELNGTSNSMGAFNMDTDAFVIGNGGTSSALSNAFRVTFKGEVYGNSAFHSSGADYAEFIKPWADGNEEGEDRVGYFVTVKDGGLYKANEGDYIVGVTSGAPSVVGNADEDYYWRYERDEFNRVMMEDAEEEIQATDKDGNLIFDEETHEPVMIKTGKVIKNARMKLAEDYDSSLQKSYIERKYRKEWDYVGMIGSLAVRDDGTCLAGCFCKCTNGGIATFSTDRTVDTYYVIERISKNVVKIILK